MPGQTDRLTLKVASRHRATVVAERLRTKLASWDMNTPEQLGLDVQRPLALGDPPWNALYEAGEKIRAFFHEKVGRDPSYAEVLVPFLQVFGSTGQGWDGIARQFNVYAYNTLFDPERLIKRAGWWAIKPGGPGIHPPPVDKGGLMNAIPGTDPGNAALYNGDGPADMMQAVLDDIDLEYRRAWGRPAKLEEIKAVFEFVFHPKVMPLNKWVEDAAQVVGVTTDAITALSKSDLEELSNAHCDYRNSGWVLGKSYSTDEFPEPTSDAQQEWGDIVRWIVEGAQEDARKILLQKCSSAEDGKKTGDRSGVGFFIPLPSDLAEKFPDRGPEDQSAPHTTFLYVGEVPKDKEDTFLETSREVFRQIREPVRGHLKDVDYFTHPDKERRVAILPVQFSHDLAGLRWNLRDALMDAGVQVDDSFPLVYQPHSTLAYLDGIDTEFEGEAPKGQWEFNGIEVWGLPKAHTIEFGQPLAQKVAKRHLDAMTDEASQVLMKFLSEAARKLGVGQHVYVVGGAVRNFVIKQPIKDIDIVIDSLALGRGRDSVWFAKNLQKAIPVSTNVTVNNYGVALLNIKGDWEIGGVNLKGEDIEIANARKESYGGEAGKGYKPHMVEPATIEEDVLRREFTFNCMGGDTLIPTEKGILRIDEIAPRKNGDQQDISLTMAGQNGSAVAVGWQYSGYAPTLRVTTEWGHSFSCTPHHPVRVLRGHDHEWVQADQLEEGDLLCVPFRQVVRKQPLTLRLSDPAKPSHGRLKEVCKPHVMTPELAFVIGCVVAEESNTHKTVSFSNSDRAFISRYVECFSAVFGFQPSYNKVVKKGSIRTLRGVKFVANADGYDIYADSKTVVGWMDELGLYCGGAKDGKSASHHKVVPWSILQADEPSQWAFLAAYLEGDGSIRPDTGRITFCSVSPHIRQQLQVLLGAHGILSKVKDRFVFINTVDSARLWEKVQPWMVTKSFDYTQRDNKSRNRYGIPKDYLQGFLYGRRIRVGNNQGPSVYQTDEGTEVALGGVLETLRRPKRILHDAYARGDFDGFLTDLKSISSNESARLQRLFDLGYQYVEVTSVEDAGEQDVFDISMGKGVEPAFVANGVVVHNTLMWRLQDLAKGPDKAEIIDLTGCGLKDLQEGVAKCPQPPDKVFSDDPSRMIRAIKFLLKYGLKIAPDVEASIKKNRAKLKNIPGSHLSNMIINVFYEGGIGKAALLEMKRLGLLDVVREIAQKDKGFRRSLGNWADKSEDLQFVFDLMDLGMPSGRKLRFLTPKQIERVREITVQMRSDEANRFVGILTQPGKVVDSTAVIREFGLKGRDAKRVQEAARLALLDDPVLAASPKRLTDRVRKALGGTSRKAKERIPGGLAEGKKPSDFDPKALAKGTKVEMEHTDDKEVAREIAMDHLTEDPKYYDKLETIEKHARKFELNVGDPLFTGKYLNSPGRIEGFGTMKGDPSVKVRKQPKKEDGGKGSLKEVKLFKVRYDEERAKQDKAKKAVHRVASRYLAKLLLPKARWVETKPQELDLDQKRDVWDIYHVSYGSLGQHISGLSQLLGKYDLFWLVDVSGDETVDAFIAYNRTPAGKKMGLFGSDGTLKAKRAVITKAIQLMKSPGWYAECSGRPAQIMDSAGIPRVDSEEAVRGVLRKDIEWLGDGKYKRTLGALGSFTKMLYGQPVGSISRAASRCRVQRLILGEGSPAAQRVAARYRAAKRISAVHIDPCVPQSPAPGRWILRMADAHPAVYTDVRIDGTDGNAIGTWTIPETSVPLLLGDNRLVEKVAARYLQAKTLTLYHGTTQEFDRFDLSKAGKRDTGNLGRGIYLTKDPTFAMRYAEDNARKRGAEPVVLTVRASVSNVAPFYRLIPQMQAELGAGFPPKAQDKRRSEMLRQWLMGQGYDAAEAGSEVVVFDPRKLKIMGREGVPTERERMRAILRHFQETGEKLTEQEILQHMAARVVGCFYERTGLGLKKVKTASRKQPWQMTLAEFSRTDPQWAVKNRPQSFEEWVQAKGVSLRGVATEHEEADFIGGELFQRPNRTRREVGKHDALRKKVQQRRQLVRQYKKEVPQQKGQRSLAPLQNRADRAALRALHKREIRKALRAHKPVPPEVLAEYPELGGTKTASHLIEKVAARYQKKKQVPKADGKGTTTVYEYSDGQVAARNREKAKRVEKLRGRLTNLQTQIKKDLKSNDRQKQMAALAVGLINDTYERVGNKASARDGHFGVTQWRVEHVTVGKGKATFKYVGKSGVKQTKDTTDADIVRVLQEAVKGKDKSDLVFDTGDVVIDSADVNAYLEPFDITAKDIRGLHANRVMQQNLKAVRGKGGQVPTDKKKREDKLKAEFNKALEQTAADVGHEPSTLKSQYLVPGLEDNFMRDGAVKDKLDKQGGRFKVLDLTGDSHLTLREARKLKRHWESRGWSADIKSVGRGRFSVSATKIPPGMKTAIINVNHATDGDTPDLRGQAGMLSSLMGYERAIVQDMLIQGAPILKDGGYTLRGHVVRPDAVTELVGAGYLEDRGEQVTLSPMLQAKLKLYAKIATKTPAEKEQDEAERMVRPLPKKKPPRHDLRRDRMEPEDEDAETQGADKNKDLSLNYKRVAARWVAKMAGKVPHDKKPKNKGDYWQTPTGSWGVFPPNQENPTSAPDEAKAKAMAEGGGGKPGEEPSDEDAAKVEKEETKRHRKEEYKKALGNFDNFMKGLDDPSLERQMAGVSTGEVDSHIDRAEKEIEDLRQKAEDPETKDEERQKLKKQIDKVKDEVKRLEDKRDSLGATKKEMVEAYQGTLDELQDQMYDADGNLSEDLIERVSKAFTGRPADDARPVELGKFLARKALAQRVLANPTIVGGRRINNSIKTPDQLAERAKESLDQYIKVGPELRQEGAKQIQNQMEQMDEGSPEHQEMDRILDGLYLAAAIKDEALEVRGEALRPPMSKSWRTLAMTLYNQGNIDTMLGTVQDFSSPEGRENISDSLNAMSDDEMMVYVGGEDGEYGEIVKSLKDPDVGAEQKAYLIDYLKRANLNDITTGHQVLVDAADIAWADKKKMSPQEVQNTLDKIHDEVRRSPSVKDTESKFLKCMEKAVTQDDVDSCKKLQATAEIRQLSEYLHRAETTFGELPKDHPVAVQIRKVIETGDVSELTKKYIQQQEKRSSFHLN